MYTSLRSLAVALVAGVLLISFSGGVAHPTEQSLSPYLADATDPAVTTLVADLGISLDEARRRIGWQAPATQVGDELAQTLGETFGGLWFDERDGGRIKVGLLVGATDQARLGTVNAILTRWQLTAVTDVVPTHASYAQLERDSAWLGSLVRIANEGAPRELASAMRINESQPELALHIPTGIEMTAAQNSVVALATQRLGERLRIDSWAGGVQRQICTYWQGVFICDAPLRGGVALFLDDGRFWCTTAFNVRSLSDGKWYVMTAGHCGQIGTRFWARQYVTGTRHVVGRIHNRSIVNNDDYSIMDIENVVGWNPKPWVWVHGGATTTTDYQYTISGTSTSPIGTRVCISGANSSTETSCGEVREVNWNGEGGLARAEYCSDPGDSGGPIYSDHLARGTHVGVVTGHENDCQNALFQGVREAVAELNVYVVTG